MKQSELKKVVDFYNNVIVQQIIKPIEIREIYKLVKPDGQDVPYFQKMRAITVYVQGLQQQVIDGLDELFTDFDEQQEDLTSDPRLSTYIPKDSAASPITPDDTQSHSESHSQNHDLGDTQEVEELQAQYDSAVDANEKRSLKMRINKLKKDGK